MNGLGEEKKKAIMRRYNRVILQHGKMAKFISRGEIYREVALPFFIDQIRVGQIIRELLKNGYSGSEHRSPEEVDIDNEIEVIVNEQKGEGQ